MKKKIICSNIAVHEEMFGGTEITFFDISKPESLAAAIEKSFSISGEFPVMQKCFQEKFSPEVICNRLLEIYSDARGGDL